MEDWALPEFDLLLCDHCGLCVEWCPAGAAEMGANGPFIARPADCTYCALCESLCSQGAITCWYEIVWGTETQGGGQGSTPRGEGSWHG